jgi:hypothetical protein
MWRDADNPRSFELQQFAIVGGTHFKLDVSLVDVGALTLAS